MPDRYPDKPEQASNGKAFEDMAADVLINLFGFDETCRAFPDKTRQYSVGESAAGVEYKELKKADDVWHLEFMEKTAIDKPAVPSGIFRMDNTWLYVCGNEQKLLGFEKTNLLNHIFDNAQKYSLYHHPTILSFRLSKLVALELSLIAARHYKGKWCVVKNKLLETS